MNILEEFGINFDAEIEKNPDLKWFIDEAIKNNKDLFTEYENPLERPDAPKLNDDFSNYFVIAGLPIVGEDKKQKLIEHIVNIF